MCPCGAFSQQLRPGSPSRPSVASVNRPLAPRCSCGTSRGEKRKLLGVRRTRLLLPPTSGGQANIPGFHGRQSARGWRGCCGKKEGGRGSGPGERPRGGSGGPDLEAVGGGTASQPRHQAPQLLEIGGSILWGVNRLFEDRSVAQTMQLLTRCRLLPGAPGSEAPPDGESWRPDAGPGWEDASESARWRGRSRALWAGRSRGVWKGAQGPGACVCVCGRAAGFICKHGTSAESRGRSGAVGVIREGRRGAGARSQAGPGASRGATGEA